MKQGTIKDIKEMLRNVESETDPLLTELAADPRKGVQNLLKKWQQSKLKKEQEMLRYQSMQRYEQELKELGYHYIAGIDEAGRGPLAGPVVSAAVILHENSYIEGLNDSKQLNEKKRLHIFEQIMEKAYAVGIGIVSAEEIDQMNIYQAAKRSMHKAVESLPYKPDYLLIDAMELHSVYPEKSLVKGDALSVSIAAASIIAKVTRDRIMLDYHEKYPDYGFNLHMGYGTKGHLDAINTYGPCPIHRMTFAPLKAGMK